MKRRALVVGAVGAVSAAGGAYWSWRSRTAEPAGPDLWSLEFDTPSGAKLPMAALRGRPLVLNFWAPWCAPCIQEMPQLDRFHQAYGSRGWQVLGLALDQPEAVRAFLAKVPVAFPIALGGVNGLDLGRQLGNDQGALPYTVVFDAAGQRAHQRLGKTTYDELAGWAGGG